MEIKIVNCFCTKETGSGNPAAIVRRFSLDGDGKEKLAKELRSPVTVFLSDENQRVEFFYPKAEMPLCLHGTMGAAAVLFQEINNHRLELITKTDNKLEIRNDDKIIQVRVSRCSIPAIQINKNLIMDMLNLKSVGQLNSDFPLTVTSVGSPKLLVPLASFDLLASLKPNFDLITKWSIENGINGLYTYTNEVKNQLDFYARGFNPKTGYHEDAATGVAAAALALSLKRSIIVGQGLFMQRPSEINVSYENEDNIWIGGKAQISV